MQVRESRATMDGSTVYVMDNNKIWRSDTEIPFEMHRPELDGEWLLANFGAVTLIPNARMGLAWPADAANK
jgi:hypothetical protein